MEKQAMKDFKHIGKSSCNFGGNLKPNYTPLYPRLKKQCIFNVKLNDY